MGKVSSTYPTLLGGVSQAPESRRTPSDSYDIVNMVPDAVKGLTRRNGTLRAAAVSVSGTATLNTYATMDASGFVGYDFSAGDVDYTLFLRKNAKPGSSPISAAAVCVNKTAGTLLTVSVKGGDTAVDALVAGGASSACNVGALLAIAGKTITPTFTTEYPWAIEENQKRAMVWVRGGAYSRRYRMCLVRGNQKLWVQYTTKDPAYPARLDTSDLNPKASDYLKRVNDRTNAYNTASTQWINSALADITPENIANRLAAALVDAGYLASSAVKVIGSVICITDPSIEDVEADDGGDGPLIRAVGNTVGAPELLSVLGYPGKVVKVRPGNSTDGQVFYLKARAKDGSTGEFTPCTWEETPGELFTPTLALVFAAVSGSTCYVSSDVGWINTNASTNFPTLQPNNSGDSDSNPPPEFFNSNITNVAVFQDRLIVSKANGYVATSRPGDYLNFFRQSVLTVVDNDPVSFAIIGGESDTVRHSLMYDRNLVLIGDKKQYLISGKQKLAPGSASATVMSSIPGTTGSAPVLVEDRLFYTKGHNGYGSLHWFKPGQIAESPVTEEATENVDTYIAGVPMDIAAVLTPDVVLVRAPNVHAASSKLYVLHYGVVGQGRMNAMHRWEFDAATGPLVGMAHVGGKVFLVSFRQSGADIDAVLDTLDLQPGITGLPYLDSMSTADNGQPLKARPTDYVGGDDDATLPGSGTPYFGYPMQSYAVLGTPRLTTQTGQTLMDGDLIVSSLDVKLADAGGVAVQVDNSQEAWAGYLRGREAYVKPVYPGVAVCPSTVGFPGCEGGSGPDPASFTHYITADKSGAWGWTVYSIEPIDEINDRYLLTHNEIPYVYGQQSNLGAADVVDFPGSGPMRPMAKGHSRSVTTVFNTAQVNIPVQAGGSVTVVELEEGSVQFTTSSGEVYIWTTSFGAVGFTYTLTRQAACPLPCELDETVVSDSRWAGESQAPEERSMSITDVGSPTTTDPVTDAAPYDQVSLHLPIGRRAGQYRATIAAYHWAPLTIASVDWTGQYHNRTRRV